MFDLIVRKRICLFFFFLLEAQIAELMITRERVRFYHLSEMSSQRSARSTACGCPSKPPTANAAPSTSSRPGSFASAVFVSTSHVYFVCIMLDKITYSVVVSYLELRGRFIKYHRNYAREFFFFLKSVTQH